jgi:hypothetical protein
MVEGSRIVVGSEGSLQLPRLEPGVWPGLPLTGPGSEKGAGSLTDGLSSQPYRSPIPNG